MKNIFAILLFCASLHAKAASNRQIDCNVGYLSMSGITVSGPQKIITVDQSPFYEIDLEDSGIKYQGSVQILTQMESPIDAIWLTANFKDSDQTISASYWQQRGVGAELRFVVPKNLWINGEKTFASFLCTVR